MSDVNLPKGWARAPFSDVLDLQNGFAYKSSSYVDIGAFVIRIGNVQDGKVSLHNPAYIDLSELKNSPFELYPEDILVSLTGNVGRVAVIQESQLPAVLNQRVARVICNEIERRFAYYSIKTKSTFEAILNTAKGAAQLNVSTKDILSICSPLPPLAEQKVIANKLDTLLAQVENTKARLERIPEILKTFRQSVLSAAVSGKLTEEWREGNPSQKALSLADIEYYWVLRYQEISKKRQSLKLIETASHADIPPSWLSTKLGYVFDVFVGATPSRNVEAYWNGDLPWVSSSEVAFCRIVKTKEKITELGLKNTSTSIHPRGTVMLAMIGQGKTRGQVAILDIEACHNQNTAALRVPEGFVVSEYLYFYLTKQYEETRRVGGGNNQQALNKSFVQSLEFPLPPYEEQTQIVRHVEELFALADNIEQKANAALERVNNLTQAILAKAFRGELTADWRAANPNLISGENSAEALLEKIKAEREALKKQTNKKTAARKRV
ncbi:restriction endonuclease subunit S [Serratia sp. NPDC078593]|uniref:restriction endonuclease subunit S n=1 Tax=unclassified Serratia (in: enterobacteria) TaxID=2647522 RepID=UPI0037D49A6D